MVSVDQANASNARHRNRSHMLRHAAAIVAVTPVVWVDRIVVEGEVFTHGRLACFSLAFSDRAA